MEYIRFNTPPPPQAELGGQVSPVAICDVGVFSEEQGDLLVGVQPYPLGYEHRPVLVAAQLHVVGSLQQLLGHLQQHLVLSLLRVKGKLAGGLKLVQRGESE